MRRGTPHQIQARIIKASSPPDQLLKTVQLIAHGIRAGSHYPPIRMLAAQIAARAQGRKDYHAQLHALFAELLKRWRYVKDPLGLETVVTSGRAIHDLVLGAADASGRGHGDCDDATVALGAMARAIGIQPRIVVMAAPLKPGQRGPARASHVYPEFHIPGRGWVAADPVAWPRCPFGHQPRAAWKRRFDLDARPIGPAGLGEEEIDPMYGTQGLNGLDGWEGCGLEVYGLAGTDGAEPEDWGNVVQGFGAFADRMGIMNGCGLLAEVDPDTADGLARTPMMEIAAYDFDYVRSHGAPYVGMCALGDDGSVYQYQYSPQVGGFFKSIFKGAKKLFKKGVKMAKGIIKHLPGGKYLIKLHNKLHKVAMKMVRPLAKFVGPLAKKLAPIAALIPGYGPAISAALHATGSISDLVKKHGIKKGKGGKLKFTSPKQARAFKLELKARAKKARSEKLHKKPGLLKKGSPEHEAKIRAAGAQPVRHKKGKAAPAATAGYYA